MIFYHVERIKPSEEKCKSAQACCGEVGNKYNTTISKRLVQNIVQKDMAWLLPKMRGPDSEIPDNYFKVLLMAYESYVHIK